MSLAARLLPLLDLTSLGEDDTPARIRALCASARNVHGLPAALCVYPEHVTTVRDAMAGTPVKVATVVNFPDGGDDAARIVREIRRALAAGADEIDLVLPWQALCAGQVARARCCVDTAREACGAGVTLKLIIESGALADPARIRQACELGLDAGVDFLKTSTGKVATNATPEAAALMLDVIAERGGHCGFKVAGGIRTLEDSSIYLDLVEARLGAGWITPAHFRIGASALFGAIIAALEVAP